MTNHGTTLKKVSSFTMDAALNFILSPDELRVLQVFCSTEIKKPKTYSFPTRMARNFLKGEIREAFSHKLSGKSCRHEGDVSPGERGS
jgi:hypothetical protein